MLPLIPVQARTETNTGRLRRPALRRSVVALALSVYVFTLELLIAVTIDSGASPLQAVEFAAWTALASGGAGALAILGLVMLRRRRRSDESAAPTGQEAAP